jgi:hypothetical protein
LPNQNSKLRIKNSKLRIKNSKLRIKNSKLRIQNRELKNQELKIWKIITKHPIAIVVAGGNDNFDTHTFWADCQEILKIDVFAKKSRHLWGQHRRRHFTNYNL